MNWQLHAARSALGSLPAEEVPEPATQALAEGDDSTDLAILAGLNRPTWRDIGARFAGVLAAVGVRVPPHDEAVLVIARDVAEQLLAGRVAVDAAASQLARLARDLNQPRRELDAFIGPESEICDFADAIRVNYYRPDYCAKVQEENRQEVLKAARALVGGAVEP
jgi:hypothetical protein